MDTATHFGIGALSKKAELKIETIRYYERESLLPNPPRTSGGHRSYDEGHLKRLTFIRRSRELGFSMAEVRILLALVDGGSYTCGEVRALTIDHADNVRRKIADLRRMEKMLLDISSQCEGGSIPECPIIDALLDLDESSALR